MSRTVDALIVYRILRLFATKIEDFDAYRLGIINADGKKIRNPKTEEERNAWSLLVRFVIKVKHSLLKSPDMNARRLLTFAAAIAILREHKEAAEDNLDLLELYMQDESVIREAKLLEEHNLVSFRSFLTDEVAANAVGAGGIDGIGIGPKGEPGRDPVFMPIQRRKKKDDRAKTQSSN